MNHDLDELDFDIPGIPLPESDEYPDPSSLNENSDPYIVARSHDCEVVKLIAGATKLVYKILRREPYKSPTAASVRSLVRFLWQFQVIDIDTLLMGRRVNPYLDLLLKARDLIADGISADAICPLTGSLAEGLRLQIDAVVARMRQRAASPEWQVRIETILRRCRDNHQSLTTYVESLYRCRSTKLLVLRIDFGYAADHATMMSRPFTISEEQAKADFEQLIRHVREHYDFLGYARRLEYGVFSGIHFHAMIFLNGHEAWHEGRIAHLLGEVWRDRITKGQGRSYNCNRQFYRHRGIGLVGYQDVQRRHYLLEYAGRYLTKAEFWVEGERSGKAFVRGLMPEEPSGVGRPRADDFGRCTAGRWKSSLKKTLGRVGTQAP